MLMAMASFIGKFALRQAIEGVVAGQVEQVVMEQLADKLMDTLERKAAQRPRILGVESETWYMFHMAQERYWTQANRFLANQMGDRMRVAYNDVSGKAVALPFALTTASTEEGLIFNFRKAPRSEGYSRALCREATVAAIRGSMKAYVRMAAAGIPIEG